MGKEKQPQYQYDTKENDYKYLRKFDSLSEVFKVFGKTKGNFYEGREYRVMENGTIVSNYRIGRDKLRKLERIRNCKLCTKNEPNSKEIEVFNLRGEKVAEFKSLTHAELISGVSSTTIYSQCKNKSNTCWTRGDINLLFRFKK